MATDHHSHKTSSAQLPAIYQEPERRDDHRPSFSPATPRNTVGSRGPAPNWQAVSVRNVVGDVLALLKQRIEAQQTTVVIDIPSHRHLLADADSLRRAVFLMVVNALDSMPKGGELAITAIEVQGRFELEVADSGPGLPDTLRHHMTEALVAERSKYRDSSLAVIHQLAQAQGGSVSAVTCPEGGAAFTISLPTRPMEAAA